MIAAVSFAMFTVYRDAVWRGQPLSRCMADSPRGNTIFARYPQVCG